MAARFRRREVLEAAEISQSEFSRLANLSFATVHRLSTNATAQGSMETLDMILTALEERGMTITLMTSSSASRSRSAGEGSNGAALL